MLFNIRVYGILKNEYGDILVSDEFIQGKFYTKFCGGGLEYGEGTIDCLVREFKEELDIRVEVGLHIYTTDFFVKSKFAENQQVISIYYEVSTNEKLNLPVSNRPCDPESFFVNNAKGDEVFRFIPKSFFIADSVSLPIDKVVAKIISSK